MQECVGLYEELSYSLQYLVVDGKMIILVKFNTKVIINTNDLSSDQNDSINGSMSNDSNLLGYL